MYWMPRTDWTQPVVGVAGVASGEEAVGVGVLGFFWGEDMNCRVNGWVVEAGRQSAANET